MVALAVSRTSSKRISSLVAVRVIGFVFALAWFLPTHENCRTLADGIIPGVAALQVSLTPLTDQIGGGGPNFNGNGLEAILSVCSGLTNIVFIAGVFRLSRRSQSSTKAWALLLFCSAAINTFWFMDLGPASDFRAGYWLWLSSFVLLGIVAQFPRTATAPESALPA